MSNNSNLMCSFVLFTLVLLSWVRDGVALSSSISRRDVVVGGSFGIGGWFLSDPAFAVDRSIAPIAILGASGRTGALCVAACLQRGWPVRALTRSGSWEYPSGVDGDAISYDESLLTVGACDVKDPQALEKGVEGCRGVIYAASASKKGGKPKEIDNVGVVAAGDACLRAKVGRYIVISSTATTRPDSLGYKFTNILGGVMDEKRKGELGVEDLYRTTSTSDAASSYTIVRPGGLEEPKKNTVLGPSTLEISQGDTLAGIISRADLAEVAVELAVSRALNLQNTALELYYTSSAQPCDGKFRDFLTNGRSPRLHGSSYQELFDRVQPNVDFYEA